MKQLFCTLFFACVLHVPSVEALPINPALGLTDFVFDFGGIGADVTFDGDSELTINLAVASQFDFHVEDCCVAGDEWDLYVDGGLTAWTVIEQFGGDGIANGGAFMGPGATYFEALATLLLPAGLHTIDLEQTAGISGGSWLNISPASPAGTAVPEPGSLLLLSTGLGAALVVLRRKRGVRS